MASDQMTQGFGGTIWSWIFFKKYNLFDSVRSIAICYGFFGLVLGFIAILTAVIYTPLQEYNIPYANYNGCLTNTNDQSKQHNSVSSRCQVTFEIYKQMFPPIYFLYYVENAYINHRNYLNSFSKKQLQGNVIDLKTAQSDCKPFVTNRDMNKNVSWSGKPLDRDAIASPCGFKAFLYFNDTFKLKQFQSGLINDIQIDQSQIGKNQGLGSYFKSRNADQQWINPENDLFGNWMQNQALMTKQKVWGQINKPLKLGKYSLIVQNNYKINTMRISKGVRILQTSNLGGKSYFIPLFFGISSVACFLYGIIFYNKFKSLDGKLQDD